MSTGLIILAMMAGTTGTDFGIRSVPGVHGRAGMVQPAGRSVPTAPANLTSAATVARSWGRVTSMRRSPEHNRRVGGVPNSFHLSGRAIDIARRSGVRHAQIDAALRNAGYWLIESLDEGDHSHFAFGSARGPSSSGSSLSSSPPPKAKPAQTWRIVYAPGASRR